MKTIQAYLETKEQEFSQHPFFDVLGQLESIEEIGYFVPELTFWAMTFQDILRINEDRVSDPYLKKVARHHRMEDAGHDRWFLHDKQYMGSLSQDKSCINNDVSWLYSREMRVARDAAYAILSEVYKADDENLNIVLLLTIESSGHVFFNKVVDQVKKTGENDNLKYFSSSHLDVELAHALYEDAMEKSLFSRELSVDQRRKALQLIDRCFDAFNKLFDGLIIACNRRLELAKERNKYHAANAETTVEAPTHQAV